MEEKIGGNPFFFLVSRTQISAQYAADMANGNFLHENDFLMSMQRMVSFRPLGSNALAKTLYISSKRAFCLLTRLTIKQEAILSAMDYLQAVNKNPLKDEILLQGI